MSQQQQVQVQEIGQPIVMILRNHDKKFNFLSPYTPLITCQHSITELHAQSSLYPFHHLRS